MDNNKNSGNPTKNEGTDKNQKSNPDSESNKSVDERNRNNTPPADEDNDQGSEVNEKDENPSKEFPTREKPGTNKPPMTPVMDDEK